MSSATVASVASVSVAPIALAAVALVDPMDFLSFVTVGASIASVFVSMDFLVALAFCFAPRAVVLVALATLVAAAHIASIPDPVVSSVAACLFPSIAAFSVPPYRVIPVDLAYRASSVTYSFPVFLPDLAVLYYVVSPVAFAAIAATFPAYLLALVYLVALALVLTFPEVVAALAYAVLSILLLALDTHRMLYLVAPDLVVLAAPVPIALVSSLALVTPSFFCTIAPVATAPIHVFSLGALSPVPAISPGVFSSTVPALSDAISPSGPVPIELSLPIVFCRVHAVSFGLLQHVQILLSFFFQLLLMIFLYQT